MNFCGNCNFVFEADACPVCGNKKIRLVQDDDFCFLTENNSSYCEKLKAIFDENGICYSALPYGSGVETRFGLPLSNFRLFVQFGSFERAKNILKDIERSETEELKRRIIENSGKLNISRKLENKIRKRIKLSDEVDIFEFCVDLIKSAEKISDEGASCYLNGGHYVFCYFGNKTLSINSETFEILSLTNNT